MKKVFLAIVAIISINAAAAQVVVELKENIATALIFPTEIIHHRGGYNPEDFVEPQIYKNILYIQPLGPFETSNLSVITGTGQHYAITMTYNPVSQNEFYVFTNDVSVYQSEDEAKIKEKNPGNTVVTESNSFVDKITAQKGYITSRNAVKYKSLVLSVTGVYTAENNIFIRLHLENSSEIPFNCEIINFTVAPKIGKDLTSSSLDILTPKWNWYQHSQVKGKGGSEIIFAFDKFTVGRENLLIIDLIEQGGVRNLTLKMEDAEFLTAKQI